MLTKILKVHFQALKQSKIISTFALLVSYALFLTFDIIYYSNQKEGLLDVSSSASLTIGIIVLTVTFALALIGILFNKKSLTFASLLMYLASIFYGCISSISYSEIFARANEPLLSCTCCFAFFINVLLGVIAFCIISSAFGLKLNRYIPIICFHSSSLLAIVYFVLAIIYGATNTDSWIIILQALGLLILVDSLPFVYHAFDGNK